jgi:hypothetical protein
MPDVQITFGANIEALKSGVDGVKDSIDGLRDSASRLAEAFGIAFTVEGIKSFVESMAELGDQTVNIGARLGQSNPQVVELSGLARLAGNSMEGFSTEIERASQNVQRSTRDGFNPAAQALRVLHLSASDLIGLPTDEYFLKIADAVSKFNPSLNLTNAVTTAFGRAASDLLPVLLQGRERLEEFLDQWNRASEGIAAATPGMAETHERLLLLEQSVTSLGARIFGALKPAIDTVVTAITNWAQSITAQDIRGALTTIGEVTIAIAQSIATFFVNANESWRTFVANINSGLPVLHLAAAGTLAMFGLEAGAIEQLREARDAFMAPAESLDQIGKNADAARAKIDQLATDARSALSRSMQPDVTQMFGAGMGGGAPSAPGRENAGAIDEGAANAAKAAQEQYQSMIAQATGAYAVLKEQYATDAATHKITVEQETEQLRSALNERWAIEQALFAREAALWPQGSAQYAAVLKQMQAAKQNSDKELQQIDDTALKNNVQQWQSILSPIESAWNSQLRRLLAGTETFGEAMKNIFSQLAITIIEKLESIAVEKVALSLASAFGSPATIAAGASKSIMASMGQMYAGEAAFFAPLLGPGAPAAAAGVVASTQATALGLTGVASMDVGGYILSDGLINAHAGETITPANVATPFQGGGSGGDTHQWNISAVDATSFQRWLGAGGANQIARAVASVQARSPSMSWNPA